MENNQNNITLKIILSLIFLWLGFVGAISFMESWLKFQAEGISMEEGLSIGKLVFKALNRVEIIIALLLISVQYILRKEKRNKDLLFLLVPFTILILQTFYLLPSLEHRANLHIQQLAVPQSWHHLIYVLLELLKISFLLYVGIKIIKKHGN